MKNTLTDRELATVLHALRKLQDTANCNYVCEHFDEHEPLNDDEIDELCERLNFDDPAQVEGDGEVPDSDAAQKVNLEGEDGEEGEEAEG